MFKDLKTTITSAIYAIIIIRKTTTEVIRVYKEAFKLLKNQDKLEEYAEEKIKFKNVEQKADYKDKENNEILCELFKDKINNFRKRNGKC